MSMASRTERIGGGGRGHEGRALGLGSVEDRLAAARGGLPADRLALGEVGEDIADALTGDSGLGARDEAVRRLEPALEAAGLVRRRPAG